MRFDVVTLFPEFFDGPLQCGVLGRGLEENLLQVHCHGLRQFTDDKHQTVDDRPFGGGEGMVLKPEPIFRALESLGVAEKSRRDLQRERVVLLSAQGLPFTQARARELAATERVVLLCGRYEGVDERVNDLLADLELSIGDYVLSGGELAAAVVVDAVARLLPGVLGNADSSRYESFSVENSVSDAHGADDGAPPRSTCDAGGLLDYPHYTRPAEWRGHAVPEVLSSGNHELIRRWRRSKSLEKTLRNRPDLLQSTTLSQEDQALLRAMKDNH
jgi:tRNA (guanine37-N1)-methyltransferase